MLTPHRTLQFVATFINTATTGDVAVVAAAAGQVTSLYRMHLTASGACNLQIKVGSTVVDTIQFVGAAPLPFILPYEEEPYYQTGVNQALNFNNSSAAVTIQGQISTITGA